MQLSWIRKGLYDCGGYIVSLCNLIKYEYAWDVWPHVAFYIVNCFYVIEIKNCMSLYVVAAGGRQCIGYGGRKFRPP